MNPTLQKGIETVGIAIRLDSEAKVKEAIEMYHKALEIFEIAFNGI